MNRDAQALVQLQKPIWKLFKRILTWGEGHVVVNAHKYIPR
jgi:hypothetical protein